MDLQLFVKKFEQQFDEVEPNTLTPDTKFRDIEEWSSLNVLLVISMIDSYYSVTISGDDIKSATTIQDIFNITSQKVVVS
jgi:acyl carrier protein